MPELVQIDPGAPVHESDVLVERGAGRPLGDVESPDLGGSSVGESMTLAWSRVVKQVVVHSHDGGLVKGGIGQPTSGAGTPPAAGTTKQILNGVSGCALPGQILALMGPSGSGKTTLIDVLAGRGEYQDGTVTVNGLASGKHLKRKIAYVQQADIFFGHLTVRDQLTYTALLRLPTVPGKSRMASALAEVDRVLALLRLGKCADTKIMLVSGGEKKRTNIGTELLTNPRLIFLDEPTSGLDSTSAVALVRTLHSFAKHGGKTIITSIHQPSSSVFSSFDALLLLADGSVVYSGTPAGSLEYFAAAGFPCPPGYNAADHCMDLLVVDAGVDNDADSLKQQQQEEQERANGGVHQHLHRPNGGGNGAATNGEAHGEFKSEPNGTATAAGPTAAEAGVAKSVRAQLIAKWDNEADACAAEKVQQHKAGEEHQHDDDPSSKWSAPWTTQLAVLTHRSMKNSRSALFTPLNFLKSIALGAIVGLCWFQMEDTEEYVDDRAGFTFFAMTFWVFDSLFGALMAFPSEREVVFKERSSGSYQLSAYFLAKTVSEAPIRLVLPCLYILISYWMSNMRNDAGAFFGFAGLELFCVLAGESIGLLIGATVHDFESAIVAATLGSLALMLTGGYFVENIPSYVKWVKFLSPFKYSYDGCLHFEFAGRKTPCDGSGVLGNICGGTDTGDATGKEVLDYLGVQGSLEFNILMLMVLFVVVRIIAYLALRYNKGGGGRH